MKRLKTLMCAGAIAAVGLAATSASAQAPRFTDIDRDGNGRLSHQELVSVFGRSAADRLWRLSNGRELTPGELSRLAFGRGGDDDRRSSSGWNDDDDDDGRISGGGSRWNDDDDDDDRGGRGWNDDDDDDDDDDDGGRSSGGNDDDD